MLESLIATALLAGDPTVDQAIARLQQTFGHPWPWLSGLAQRFAEAFHGHRRPLHQEVADFVARDRGLRIVRRRYPHQLHIKTWLAGAPLMRPLAEWPIPALTTPGALADWLGLDPADLLWFADLKSLERQPQTGPLLRHYEYSIQVKASGGLRLIESPKTRLKQLQRQILRQILDVIPAHPAAHGFVKGRSIKTFAAPHTGQRFVLRVDLENFFPSLRRARLQALFRTLGYPEAVADSLGGLCTNWTPRHIWNSLPVTNQLIAARYLYGRPHLPQGAPTSPALANLCAYRLDCRLTGLASSAGANYTRYADDLAFSGSDHFRRGIAGFLPLVRTIVEEEGFRLHPQKTRHMPASTRQQVAGVVANQHPNVPRQEFDQLKATLTNCLRHGPESQNRHGHSDFRAHLAGRIAHCAMLNPAKARRLQTLWEKAFRPL